MHVEYLIIGQGISGTWLSYYLQKAGISFIVIDNNDTGAASRMTAGIINPVTGRRHVTVWMAETILPFAKDAYEQLGLQLGIKAISQKEIIDFFPSPQMRQSFIERIKENDAFIQLCPEPEKYTETFHFEFGCGTINTAYTVHLEKILPAWRKRLIETNHLLEEQFEIDLLLTSADKISYKDLSAGKIIFCDGSAGTVNPFFRLLPFAPNKGEVLIADIPSLAANRIYKKGMVIAPLASPGTWWIGSSYEWKFENTNPTKLFREKTEELLKNWLKIPFTITGHFAGIRPATIERRPFVGLHPHHPHIGILNGMGTKGCSLAPFFAKQLFDHLVSKKEILPAADIKRFSKILAR